MDVGDPFWVIFWALLIVSIAVTHKYGLARVFEVLAAVWIALRLTRKKRGFL